MVTINSGKGLELDVNDGGIKTKIEVQKFGEKRQIV